MRVSRAALVFIALPIALGAQQAPPNPVTTVMKQRTMTFQQRLAQAFDSIPEKIFGYKPTPAQLTIGYIAQHLADDNYFYCNQFGTMKGTRSAEDTSTPDTVKAKWPKAKLIAPMKTSFKFCEDALAQLGRREAWDQISQTAANGQTRTVTRAGPGDGTHHRHGGPLQPARELHAAEQHSAANGASASSRKRLTRFASPRRAVGWGHGRTQRNL
jgi:hypothetical protein